MPGALDGVTIIELAAIGPVPFAGMMLADHGARVVRIERPGVDGYRAFGKFNIVGRNREIVECDLKDPDQISKIIELAKSADALIEGFRPGVLERLGLGPEVLHEANPALVIGRMTGWGQEGPLAGTAGHDINYIALSGALHTYGRKGDKPTFPTNAVGDYGGGGMMLAFGVLAGILSARSTGKGQVVDCAMLDGASLITATTYMLHAIGWWQDERGVNMLDSGAPYYETYETADRKFVSIGPLEDEFHDELLERLGIKGEPEFADRENQQNWPAQKQRLTEKFLSKTRDEWCAVFEGSDACFAPVLSLSEAPSNAHNVARGTFIDVDGVVQPAPAPRFSETPAPPVRMPGT